MLFPAKNAVNGSLRSDLSAFEKGKTIQTDSRAIYLNSLLEFQDVHRLYRAKFDQRLRPKHCLAAAVPGTDS
jgi:hypothetical protein